MRVGYARVSTDDQNLDRQRAALAEAGCGDVVEEIESGVKARNRLIALLARKTPKLAAVALANKIARIAWVMMTTGEVYDSRRANPATV